MNTFSKSLIAMALEAASAAASADAITYSFTGSVFSSDGSYTSAANGSTVTGIFTVDVANGLPSQSLLPVSTNSRWYSQEMTGSFWGLPPSNGYVFSFAARDGSISYQTDLTPGTYNSQSILQDDCGGGVPGCGYNGYESNSSVAGIFTFSGIYLLGTYNTNDGLPLLSGPLDATGHFGAVNADGTVDDLWYNFTSISPMTPTPLPDTAWLLASALAAFGTLLRKHREVTI